jgi:hypothetical protein
LGLGLVIGLQHAFEPDHVAAVSTQVSKIKFHQGSSSIKSAFTKSSLIGILWGAGHTTSILLVGLLVSVFALSIQEGIFDVFESAVGLMLVFLGLSIIFNKNLIRFRHRHPHQHVDGTIHFEVHQHDDPNHRHNHRSYLIGLLHGLAGSGSLIVLTTASMHNFELIISLILVFGVGSIIGMVVASGLIGLPFVFSRKFMTIQKVLRYITAIVSIAIGANIIYQFLSQNQILIS